MGFAFRFLLGQDVQGNFFTFGPWRMHLRQKSLDVTSDFRMSFAFEHIVNGIPALLYLATGSPSAASTPARQLGRRIGKQ
jgi:hypothetical protein